jgi:hypothetical protein
MKLSRLLAERGLWSSTHTARALGLTYDQLRRVDPAALPVHDFPWKGHTRRVYDPDDVRRYAQLVDQLRRR